MLLAASLICEADMSKNAKKLRSVDPAKLLAKKMQVKSGDDTKLVSPDELAHRNLLNRAIKGDMRATKRIVNECISTEILIPTAQTPYCPSVIHIPDHWTDADWHAMYAKHGLPPWPGDDDGFSDKCREEYRFWRKNGHHSWMDRT